MTKQCISFRYFLSRCILLIGRKCLSNQVLTTFLVRGVHNFSLWWMLKPDKSINAWLLDNISFKLCIIQKWRACRKKRTQKILLNIFVVRIFYTFYLKCSNFFCSLNFLEKYYNFIKHFTGFNFWKIKMIILSCAYSIMKFLSKFMVSMISTIYN